mgnify:FL=1
MKLTPVGVELKWVSAPKFEYFSWGNLSPMSQIRLVPNSIDMVVCPYQEGEGFDIEGSLSSAAMDCESTIVCS